MSVVPRKTIIIRLNNLESSLILSLKIQVLRIVKKCHNYALYNLNKDLSSEFPHSFFPFVF